MAKPPQHKAVSYIRDLSIIHDKFAEFDRLCREAPRSGANTVLIVSPQILGDNYEELIQNLSKLAQAGLALVILPQKPATLN